MRGEIKQSFKPARLKLTPAKRYSENELHEAVAGAFRRLLLPGVVWTTWESRNAAQRPYKRPDGTIGYYSPEGRRRQRCGLRKGWPDMGLFWSGNCMFLELKAPGEKPDADQIAVHDELRAIGFSVSVADSVEAALLACQAGRVPMRGFAL